MEIKDSDINTKAFLRYKHLSANRRFIIMELFPSKQFYFTTTLLIQLLYLHWAHSMIRVSWRPFEKIIKWNQQVTNIRTQNLYPETPFNESNKLCLSKVSGETIRKNLLSLQTKKNAKMDEKLAKFLKDGALVMIIPLTSLIHLAVKLPSFTE